MSDMLPSQKLLSDMLPSQKPMANHVHVQVRLEEWDIYMHRYTAVKRKTDFRSDA